SGALRIELTEQLANLSTKASGRRIVDLEFGIQEGHSVNLFFGRRVIHAQICGLISRDGRRSDTQLLASRRCINLLLHAITKHILNPSMPESICFTKRRRLSFDPRNDSVRKCASFGKTTLLALMVLWCVILMAVIRTTEVSYLAAVRREFMIQGRHFGYGE
ncbi:hypothetical protein C8R45DRAFT_1044757, partial [Mycena sanguinolenta]